MTRGNSRDLGKRIHSAYPREKLFVKEKLLLDRIELDRERLIGKSQNGRGLNGDFDQERGEVCISRQKIKANIRLGAEVVLIIPLKRIPARAAFNCGDHRY